jgi:hypothetical protein
MHSLLEQYLSEVAVQLKPLPPKRRDEELREMRQHLLNAVTVNLEQGLTEDDAVAKALKQFGSPQAVAQDTVMAWRREFKAKMQSFCGTALATFGLTNALQYRGVLLSYNFFTQIMGVKNESYAAIARLPLLLHAGFIVANICVILSVPILIGSLCGLLVRKQGLSGVIFATLLFYIYNLTIFVWHIFGLTNFVEVVWRLGIFPSFPHTINPMVVEIMVQFFVCAAAAILSAWQGSRWREKRIRLALN